MGAMKVVPLFGVGVAGKSLVATAQQRINCYWESRNEGEKQQEVLIGTPGTREYLDLGASPSRGIRNAGGYFWSVHGNTLYRISYGGTPMVVGTLSSNNGNVSMAHFVTPTLSQLLIVDGVTGYIVNMTTLVMGTPGTNFPTGATHCAVLGGYFVANKPGSGQFYVSNQYDGLVWTTAGNPVFGTAEANPDNITALWVDHGNLILMGDNSIEFWQLAGTFPLPFAPLSNATQQYGIGAAWSLASIGDHVVFLGSEAGQGPVSVYAMSPYAPRRISTPDVDFNLNKANFADAVGFGWAFSGHSFYQVSLLSAARTFLFDFQTRSWSEMQTGVASTARHIAQFSAVANGRVYVTAHDSGKILYYDEAAYDDNGEVIPMILVSRHLENSGNKLFLGRLWLDMETGVGLQSGQGSNPQIMAQRSKDGGRTYGLERWRSFGAVGEYKAPRAIWRRNGASIDTVFRFKITDPVKRVITRAAISMMPGSG